MLAVPLDRPPQPLVEVDRGLPAAALADLRPVDELAVDLPLRLALAAHLGLHPGPGELGDPRDDVPDPVRPPAAGVEGLAADVGAVEGRADREVCVGRVLDVEEVALGRAVGAQHRRPSLDRSADRLGDDPREVQVAAAVGVREPGHRHRQSVRRRVGAGDDVGGRLRRLVGGGRLERELLAVGELGVGSVGLVRRGDHDPFDARLEAGVEQGPGTAHVGLERAQRRLGDRADDRLGAEVEHVGDPVLAQRPDQRRAVAAAPLAPPAPAARARAATGSRAAAARAARAGPPRARGRAAPWSARRR